MNSILIYLMLLAIYFGLAMLNMHDFSHETSG